MDDALEILFASGSALRPHERLRQRGRSCYVPRHSWSDRGAEQRVEKPAPSSWRRFLRLWFVLGFAYVAIKFLFNLGIMGWVDLRPVAFLELALVPLGQSVVFWVITRRARKGAAGRD